MTTIDVVIPVYNEEHILAQSVATLRQFLKENMPQSWRIVIADNGSSDKTWEIAQSLAREHPDVITLHLDEKGRGRALRHAWLESSADIVSYMDVDLSTDLEAFPRLIQAIEEGHDVAIGSRHLSDSSVRRSLGRELTSRSYNFLIKAMFLAKLSDAQCGFKALSSEAARKLVPLIRDRGWFFDTELLILAHKKGCRIKEIAVAWVEDPDSRVSIPRTALQDLKGLLRMRFRPLP
ncbi:MAG: glycosyltransferase family 2 protein [Dehalococcoidia bacterium]|nr:glycosyltransferase family 2 protein [Dehalococcoidia bacterium]